MAVQELARFRKRVLPSHFLLNCAITWQHHKGKYHYTEGRKRAVFHSRRNLPRRCKNRKAQPHRDPGKEKLHFTSLYISSSKRNVSEKRIPNSGIYYNSLRMRDTEVSSPRLTFKYLPPMNYEIIAYFFHFAIHYTVLYAKCWEIYINRHRTIPFSSTYPPYFSWEERGYF